MMNKYVLYVFIQDDCKPSSRLIEEVKKLPKHQQQALAWVPLKYPNGRLTSLAEKLDVELTPTLAIVHETLMCTTDSDGDEDCDQVEEPVEIYIGATGIIEHLQANIDAYSYANPPE